MGGEYTPRRAGKRWLEGAPAYVLDCFDEPSEGADRYTVFFGKDHMSRRGSYAESWVSFLGMSDAPTHPQGISMWSEMPAYDAAMFRYERKRRRVRWQDLPEHIRRHVQARAEG